MDVYDSCGDGLPFTMAGENRVVMRSSRPELGDASRKQRWRGLRNVYARAPSFRNVYLYSLMNNDLNAATTVLYNRLNYM